MKKRSDAKRKIFSNGILWISCTVLLVSASCSSRDDTSEIRELIKRGAELAEQQNVAGLMKMTTGDFLADPGRNDGREVKRILWLAFRHYGNFSILYPKPKVDLADEGSVASAAVYCLIVKKDRSFPELRNLYEDPQGWLNEVGENADLYRLDLGLVKRDGDWLVNRARLESFRGMGFN